MISPDCATLFTQSSGNNGIGTSQSYLTREDCDCLTSVTNQLFESIVGISPYACGLGTDIEFSIGQERDMCLAHEDYTGGKRRKFDNFKNRFIDSNNFIEVQIHLRRV